MSPSREDKPLSAPEFEKLLAAGQSEFGLTLPPSVQSSLARYLEELDRWRRRANLTGDLSAGELVRHALESVFGSQLIAHGERLIDVGSGAGFPGLPLAIARPDLAVTLVEPRQKRAAFLRHVARALSLANVHVEEHRIENIGGQTFGIVTTRAVGKLVEWLADAPFLERNGLLLEWTTTPAALRAPSSAVVFERELEVPGSLRRVIAAFRRT